VEYRLALLPLVFAAATAGAQSLPQSSLGVQTPAGWRTWWRSDAAPEKWDRQDTVLFPSVRWHGVSPGVERAELRLSGRWEAWRIRVVLLRFDPSRIRAELVQRTRDGGTLGAWEVDSVPARAIAGFNAGQFASARPWGWLVRNGIEEQPPGFGPLSLALIVDSLGGMRLLESDSIPSLRGRVRDAFQSYPTLLEGDGVVPAALREPARGVDVGHRDSRIAIGSLRDGRMIVALTRFEGLRGALSELPFGPTVPELSALMGALGCARAVALDGGISGQLLIRAGPRTLAWRGLRRVPLGLVLHPR
jgi:hypothetical protein